MAFPHEGREAQRIEAFSDAVMAVIITIMAFSLAVPNGTTWRAISDALPSLLVYVLSFTLVGIYWNNHHHLLRATERIGGGVMWANLFLLFWLSLIPLATKWVAAYPQSSVPASAYGVVSLGAGGAYGILIVAIVRANGRESLVARIVGANVKGWASSLLFGAGIGLAWVNPWIAYALYAGIAVAWFVPDRRLVPASRE